MYDQAFATLEYDQLRALIQRGAQTPMGRARVESLAPRTKDTVLGMEGLALTGASVEHEKGLLSTIVLEMGGSSDLCVLLNACCPAGCHWLCIRVAASLQGSIGTRQTYVAARMDP